MMQDLKTGCMLGASPRSQFLAQLYGIMSGVLFAVPNSALLFDSAWDIGGDDSPLGAPAAIAWKAVAEVMIRFLRRFHQWQTAALVQSLVRLLQ